MIPTKILTLLLLLFSQILLGEGINPSVTIMVPMRDGTALPTDIYFPDGQKKDLPCILLRSPAGRKAPTAVCFAILTQKGYLVAIQDTRSALDLEGKTFPYLSDGWGVQQDGYDTVEWLSQSPLTNGKIGTLGSSALGITQLFMAPTAPESLKCQYIGVAASSLYHHAIFPGGQLRKHQVEAWLGYYANDPGVHSYICGHPFYDDFWKKLDTTHMAHRVKIPALHQGGWYDTFLEGTLNAFVSRQEMGGEGAKGQQKLLIGPWPHFWPLTKQLGDFEVPRAGYNPPLDLSPAAWFDYYLKGTQNNIPNIPAITYYVMGPFDGSPSSGNVWRHAAQWPIPHTPTPLYLTSNKKLKIGSSGGDTKSFSYRYDPHNPVPTIGGNNLFLEPGPKDQRPIEQRRDVLVFSSDPLKEDVEVTGHITANLYFSSNQQDTDIAVRLTDVYPDGKSILITDGIYRLGMGNCTNCDTKIKTGQIIEVNVDLPPTSIVFAKGHSIRISVTSSNYPRFEKNCNIGFLGNYKGHAMVATNALYVGKKYPSRLILPIVRQGDRWLAGDSGS